jgi:hypothetical protein
MKNKKRSEKQRKLIKEVEGDIELLGGEYKVYGIYIKKGERKYINNYIPVEEFKESNMKLSKAHKEYLREHKRNIGEIKKREYEEMNLKKLLWILKNQEEF